MYAIVAGGGKVGANLTRSLLRMGHEVTLIEQSQYRFERVQDEFEDQILLGDATELHVLERAGIARPPDIRPPGPSDARSSRLPATLKAVSRRSTRSASGMRPTRRGFE